MKMKITITKKFGLLLLVFLLCGILGVGSFYWFYEQEEQAGRSRSLARNLQGLTEQLYAYTNLVITGQDEGRKPLLAGVQSFADGIQAMRRGGQIGDRDVSPLTGEAREVLAQIEAEWPVLKDDVEFIVYMPVGSPESVDPFLRIRAGLPQITDALTRISEIEGHDQDNLRQHRVMILCLIIVLDAGLLVTGLWLTKRWIVAPVLSMEAGARRIQAGDFNHRISITTNDELATLALAFNEMTSELQRSIRELEHRNVKIQEASRLKSEFLANMSHELRTPLNAIIGFSELMRDEVTGPLLDEQKEYLGDILSSGRHLLQLINDILDLSKIEAGKMEFQPEQIQMEKVIGEVITILRPLAAKKRIHIKTQIDPLFNDVFLDPSKLKQVLYNYLSNALKFTPEEGGVNVRVQAEDENQFRLSVQDTGIGIRPEDTKKLFTEFQQLDEGAGKKYQGTGLGLALTRRIAEAQGGRVGVESVPGEGATFFAILPRMAPTSVNEDTVEALPTVSTTTGRKLLVIEDDARERQWLVEMLTGACYTVEAATTVHAALARCRETRFDAITMDLLLPDGSGWEILRGIRSEGPNQQTPVIVVSMAEKGVGSGFSVQDFLTKPVEPHDLLVSLERAHVRANHGQTIVVVDDDPNTLKMIERTLPQLGYQPVCWREAEVALEYCQRVQPSAIVLDLLMPGMGGLEFLSRLRSTTVGLHIPVIVWTNKDLIGKERDQLRALAQGIVSKSQGGVAPLLAELQHLLPGLAGVA